MSECDREALIIRRPWLIRGLLCHGGGGGFLCSAIVFVVRTSNRAVK